jgi:hypothetical protein
LCQADPVDRDETNFPDVVNDLPFIDEHRVLISAPALVVWRSLTTQMTRSRRAGTEAFAHLLGAEPRRASEGPLGEGSTLPGFAVAEAVPGRRLRLSGRHRFSTYALILTLVTRSDGTMLSARTHAEFPGFRGNVYRRLVIGSGAHRVLIVRLLRSVRRRAEGQSVP